MSELPRQQVIVNGAGQKKLFAENVGKGILAVF
jgi:hypothetical protein